MVFYFVALDPTFSSPLLFERFSENSPDLSKLQQTTANSSNGLFLDRLFSDKWFCLSPLDLCAQSEKKPLCLVTRQEKHKFLSDTTTKRRLRTRSHETAQALIDQIDFKRTHPTIKRMESHKHTRQEQQQHKTMRCM